MKSYYFAAVFASYAAFFLPLKNACAYPEYIAPTGASGCTSCHNDNYGNGFKPGILAAFEQGGLNGLKAFLHQAPANTKPVIQALNSKWDITVGETGLTIPVKVYDAQNNSFVLHGSAPSGYKFSSAYIDSATKLPTIDFKWTPTADQANKTYQLSVYATEINTAEKLSSNTVKTYIQVWPARTSATRNVSQFMLQNALWKNNRLNLSGALFFKSNLSASQIQTALAELTMSIKSSEGETLSRSVKLMPNSSGKWSKTISLSSEFEKVPCRIKLEYEGLKVARNVTLASSYDECED